jgi:hypothetical protein
MCSGGDFLGAARVAGISKMKATLVGIYNRGDLANERLHFRVTQNVDLGHYCVLDTYYSGVAEVQAGERTVYWLSPKQVLVGQNVVLYTKAGTPSTETKNDGQTYHFVFRGRTAPLYSHAASAAVLMELDTWSTTTRFTS